MTDAQHQPKEIGDHMNPQFLQRVLDTIEREIKSRPSPVEFEMAYQVRVAIDRIRFAIKTTDPSESHLPQLREATLQLLDALDRLESADRDFQKRFRRSPVFGAPGPAQKPVNGHETSTGVSE